MIFILHLRGRLLQILLLANGTHQVASLRTNVSICWSLDSTLEACFKVQHRFEGSFQAVNLDIWPELASALQQMIQLRDLRFLDPC